MLLTVHGTEWPIFCADVSFRNYAFHLTVSEVKTISLATATPDVGRKYYCLPVSWLWNADRQIDVLYLAEVKFRNRGYSKKSTLTAIRHCRIMFCGDTALVRIGVNLSYINIIKPRPTYVRSGHSAFTLFVGIRPFVCLSVCLSVCPIISCLSSRT